MADRKDGRKRRPRRINRFKLALLVAVLVIIMLGGVGFGVLAATVKSAPVLDPKKFVTSQTSFIYDEQGTLITKIHGAENRVHISIKEVPKQVKLAFLAIEDVNFYDHNGISFRGIARAALKDIIEQDTSQGASTITQQLVKRTFLKPEKRFKRKIQEAYLSMQLERQYTKDEILEMYLNQIYFGAGAYGIQAAANVYFNKNVQDLTLAEAALLAGLPKSPTNYDPFKNPENARNRQLTVLSSMLKYEFITEMENTQAKKEKVVLSESKKRSYPYPYFVEYVLEQLVSKYGDDKVFNGGLRVYTTLDPKIQTASEKALNNPNNFPPSKKDEGGLLQPQAGVVVLDPHTGYIKALVGGRGRDDSQQRLFNRATQAKRQPGSSFKPVIAYSPFIDQGGAPASVLDDSPLEFADGYKPKNFDLAYRGMTTIREAVTDSINIMAIQALKEVGISKAHKFAKNLGIQNLNPKNDLGLGIALGGIEQGVTPLELTRAYGAFANGGVYVESTVITKVTDQEGNIIDKTNPKKAKAMKDTTAYLMTDMLKDVVTKGTGYNARLDKWTAAGKTGTTNEGKDIWFVGYTPALVAGVWMGHDVPKPMPRIYGGTYPAKLWKEIMTEAHKGKKVVEFNKPATIVSATVCSKSGLLPSDLCPTEDLVTDNFAKGTIPNKVCSSHVEVEISAESGKLATEFCPDKISKVFLKPGISVSDPENAPTEYCTIHGPETASSQPPTLCTSAEHGDRLYLANVPGPNQAGGCPIENRSNQTLLDEQLPSEYCPLPEHQLREQVIEPPTIAPNLDSPQETNDYQGPPGQEKKDPRSYRSKYNRKNN